MKNQNPLIYAFTLYAFIISESKKWSDIDDKEQSLNFEKTKEIINFIANNTFGNKYQVYLRSDNRNQWLFISEKYYNAVVSCVDKSFFLTRHGSVNAFFWEWKD